MKTNDNIIAVRTALKHERNGSCPDETDRIRLEKFQGFGGFKAILLHEDEADLEKWKNGLKAKNPQVEELFRIVRDFCPDEETFNRYAQSMKKSALTAFYTPHPIAEAIAKVFEEMGLKADKFLEPSAGTGVFLSTFKALSEERVAYELDLITGKILRLLHPDVEVHVEGFESIPFSFSGKFDVVCSNIPFGNYKVFDPQFLESREAIRQISTERIHNYFFIKAIDALRNGGICAFITTQGVMDTKSNEQVRHHLMKHCHLISAIRLPCNLFKNTQVQTDLIVLQKDESKNFLTSREQQFIDSHEVNNGIWINRYHSDLKRIIHTESKITKGMYGDPSLDFFHSGGVEKIAETLSEWLEKDMKDYLLMNLYQKTNEPVKTMPKSRFASFFGMSEEEQRQIEESKKKTVGNNKMLLGAYELLQSRHYDGKLKPFYKDGILIADKEQVGKLKIDGNSDKVEYRFNPLPLTITEIEKLNAYITLRDRYFELSKYEFETKEEQVGLRVRLNEAYKNYVDLYGELNDKKNRKLIKQDVFGNEVLSLEFYEYGKPQLADIFRHPVSFRTGTMHNKTPEEALCMSLNKYGIVNLDFMSLVSGTESDELYEKLKERIYCYPKKGHPVFQIDDKLLTGNLVDKVYFLEEYLNENPDTVHRDMLYYTLEKLRHTIPPKIPFELLDFNLGERWMPSKYFDEYGKQLFNANIQVIYTSTLDDFNISSDSINSYIKEKYSIKCQGHTINGLELYRYALINHTPTITKKITINGSEQKVIDHEVMQLADAKIKEIRDGFTKYLKGLLEKEKDELVDIYNYLYNSSIKPSYNGSFQSFPDLHLKPFGIDELYKGQVDAVWMIKINEGGVIDHKVGGGKTLTICIAAYEMKRLGIVDKPIILGLNNNTLKIAETFQTAYPNAKILFPAEDELKRANINRFLHKIKNNNWHAIIMTHENYMKIRQSLDMMKNVINEELRNLAEDLKLIEKQTGKSASVGLQKGLITRQNNLKVKLQKVNHKISQRKDKEIDFLELGIDHIFADESQYFKNLEFTTRSNWVAGLGNPAGSQRALNLYYGIRTIQERKNKDLCATFLSGTIISNSLVELFLIFKYLRPRALRKQGITTFDSWAGVFARKTTDYEFTVTNEIKPKERYRIFIKVPELQQFYLEITDYRGVEQGKDRPQLNTILRVSEPSEEQLAYNKNLIEFVNTGDPTLIGRIALSHEEKKAKMLIVTDLARKSSLHPRLVSDKYKDDPAVKLDDCVSVMAEYYFRFYQQKGTQFFFCDVGTFKSENQWSLYSEVKQKLVQDYHIPANEIRFIQESRNKSHKQQLIDMMNEGEIRIMLGSTVMLGTGVNAQKNVVAIHNYDIPWKPSEMEQRFGRGARPGNMIAKLFNDNTVDNFVYATKNTLDVYKFNLLQTKQYFIDQLKDNKLAVRTIDEGAMSEDGAIDFGLMKAVLSGNENLIKMAKLEQEIMILESEKRAYENNKIKIGWNLVTVKGKLERQNEILAGLRTDLEALDKFAPQDENGTRNGKVIIKNLKSKNDLDIGKKLIQLDNTANTKGEYIVIGTIGGFEILVKTDEFFENKTSQKQNRFFVNGTMLKYTYNNGILGKKPETALQNFINTLSKIPSLIEKYENEIRVHQNDIEIMNEVINEKWKNADKLDLIKTELMDIQRKIENSLINAA